MVTGNSLPAELIYFIPYGTDSVIVSIPYYVHAAVLQRQVHFKIMMKATGTGWNVIWNRDIVFEGSITESGVISISPSWATEGNWVGFVFDVWGECDDLSACLEADWEIHSLTITAIGDSLALDQSTWANIKVFSSLDRE